MRFENLILLITLALVAYFMHRHYSQKEASIQRLWSTSMRQIGSYQHALNPGNPTSNPGKQLEKGSRMLAQTFTIQSQPTQFPTGKPTHGEVQVSADSGNAGDAYIGSDSASVDTGPRYTVEAGQNQRIKISELSRLWFGGTTNDIISILCEVETNG